MAPIKCGFVDFKKCNLLDNRLLLGIDCGTSLTKVIFLHKDNETQLFDDKKDFITLKHGLFKNEDFEEAIKLIRNEAYFPENKQYTVHLTGYESAYKMEFVESILGLRVEYIEENLSTIGGHRIALERIGLEQLLAAPVEVESFGKIDSKFFDKFLDAFSAKFPKETVGDNNTKSSIFPCLVNCFGSLSKAYYFDDEGRGKLVSYPMVGEISFLGLSKVLLGTNDFDEIMELASTGNYGKINTQVKDILVCDPNSPYGTVPGDIIIFPFGKCADLNKGLEEVEKKDLALSLVTFYTFCMTMYNAHLCQMMRIKKIFLTGNLFRSNLFQREIIRSMMSFPYSIQLEILHHEYFVALGSMLCNKEEKEKYCKD